MARNVRTAEIVGTAFTFLVVGVCAWMGWELFGRGVDNTLGALAFAGFGAYIAYLKLSSRFGTQEPGQQTPKNPAYCPPL